MKISKLFHWLYAFLMFLPIFAIGVKCGYVMLNKNANDSYSGSYNYDATIILTLDDNGNNTYGYNSYVNTKLTSNIRPTAFSSQAKMIINCATLIYKNIEYNNVCLGLSTTSSTYSNTYVKIFNVFYDDYPSSDINVILTEIYPNNSNINFEWFQNNNGLNPVIKSAYVNNFNLKSTYVTFVTDNNLSSVFYSSLQELDHVEFFSWAKNSFLAQPFMYIGNLFGIPNVHPIFTFLSYWMAISVIWLVFDVFMYVPLLAHKWIDKGKVD